VKRPLRSRILGSRFEIRWQSPVPDNDGEDIYGNCDVDGRVICIDDKVSLGEQQSTLVHEHIEAINEMMKVKLTHDQIEQLEVGLMQLIRDNPSLISYLRSKT